MDLANFIKNLKNFDGMLGQIKEDLRQKKEMIEKNGITITFNGFGEIEDIEYLQDKNISEVKDTLIELLNLAQDLSRDMMLEAVKRKFGGIFGF